jgi:hypothetical protein
MIYFLRNTKSNNLLDGHFLGVNTLFGIQLQEVETSGQVADIQ